MRIFTTGVVAGLAILLVVSSKAFAAPEVEVYGEAVSTPTEVLVNIYADMKEDVRVTSGGIRLLYDPAQLVVKKATKNDAVWYFTDGVKRFAYMDPDYKTTPGEVIIVVGIINPQAQNPGVGGKKVLLGTVLFGAVRGVDLSARPARKILLKSLTFGRGDPTNKYDNFVNTDGIVLDHKHGLLFGPITFQKPARRK